MAYFSNGTEGMILDVQCAECHLGESTCPVHAVQMLFNYDQLKKGNEQLREAMNLLIDGKGICQVRSAIISASDGEESDSTPIDPKSLPSFLKMDGG